MEKVETLVAFVSISHHFCNHPVYTQNYLLIICLYTGLCMFRKKILLHQSLGLFINELYRIISSPEPLGSQGELIGWP